MAEGIFKNAAVVVQCRLSSTRLPQKALRILGERECLCWTLDAMKKVPAARYFLACDFDSQEALLPLAEKCGYELFAGSRDDVLGRFCSLIEGRFPECDLVVRATGDNPFLFWEAAERSVTEFQKNHFEADYFTFTGIAHGSGVELFKAASLLKSRETASSDYDREHVGPALYRHQDIFKCVFKQAPVEFLSPDLRTTVDTFADYCRARRLLSALRLARREKSAKGLSPRPNLPDESGAFFEDSGAAVGKVVAENGADFESADGPFLAEEIIRALKNPLMRKTILVVPSVKAGRGTGHLRRSLSLAKDLKAFVYVPANAELKEAGALLDEALKGGLEEFQVVRELMGGWDLVVLDLFKSSKEEMDAFSRLGPVCSIDDGGAASRAADYLLDVIPSLPRPRAPFSRAQEANRFDPSLIVLPKRRRAAFPQKIESALVCASGECRRALSARAAAALKNLGVAVTEVTPENPVPNLRERLADYDLVATHYGFTAFEALSASCAVPLLSTSALHRRLSKKYGFAVLEKNGLTKKSLSALLQNPARLQNKRFKALLDGQGAAFREADERLLKSEGADFFGAPEISEDAGNAEAGPRESEEIVEGGPRGRSAALENPALAFAVAALSFGESLLCPACGRRFLKKDPLVARTRERTFRRCQKCGLPYISFSASPRVQYEEDYFGSEYKAQYGRSYLEDFDFIKEQGLRRSKIVLSALKKGRRFCRAGGLASAKPRLLDIGCAYGPFLAAAAEAGFEPFGTDISKSALDYVRNSLAFKCVRSSFADFNAKETFGFEQFDAIALWFVIEHCRDVRSLLLRANRLLKAGGVLAFSTPSESGVSGRFNKKEFFERSPRDHYTVWSPKAAQKILKRFGFKTVKIVSTGIHPERIKIFKKIVRKPFIFAALSLFCKWLGLGDTFELYCVKVGEAS